tara:strand:+ start:904 stop:1143 length:240 start_codon:yes stop_codon:yes gene_type:complete
MNNTVKIIINITGICIHRFIHAPICQQGVLELVITQIPCKRGLLPTGKRIINMVNQPVAGDIFQIGINSVGLIFRLDIE